MLANSSLSIEPTPAETASQKSAALWEKRISLFVWAGLLPLHVLLLSWLACKYAPTADEGAHLAAGIRILTQGRFDVYPVNPPLVKTVAAIPVVMQSPLTDWSRLDDDPGTREEWEVGNDFIRANGASSRWFFVIARWACLPFSIIGFATCYFWAKALWGTGAGCLAATLWCFSPNILGNGALLTPDVASTSLGLLTLFLFRNWLHHQTWPAALICGLVCGLCQLSKFSWLLFYPILVTLWVVGSPSSQRFFQNLSFTVVRWFSRTDPESSATETPPDESGSTDTVNEARPDFNYRRGSLQLVVMLITSLYVLNLGYGFQGTGRPLGQYQFRSETLIGNSAEDVGNRFSHRWLGQLPVPLPSAYVTGIDLQKRDFEGGWRPLYSYLRGVHRLGGWWYYYLYGLCVKVPLGFWIAVIAGTLSVVWQSRCEERLPPHELLLLVLPPALLFATVSSQTGFTRSFRYVLPALPFAMIWAGAAWSRLMTMRRAIVIRICGGLGVILVGIASLWIYPHSLAYFNVLAGGPTKGHWHLLDSNLDWGQDLYELRLWMNEHPQSRPLHLAYSGTVSPFDFGVPVNTRAVPTSTTGELPDLAPGWYAVSVNHLHDFDQPEPRWSYFQRLTPVDRAGYSILIYYIPEPERSGRHGP